MGGNVDLIPAPIAATQALIEGLAQQAPTMPPAAPWRGPSYYTACGASDDPAMRQALDELASAAARKLASRRQRRRKEA